MVFAHSQLFKNKHVFSLDYTPEKIIDRDEELNKIGYYLLNDDNQLILGGVGCGKTTSMRYMVEEYKKEYGNEKKFLYIPLKEKTTHNQLLTRMCDELIYMSGTPSKFDRRGGYLQLEKVLEKLIPPEGLYLILDEFEKIGRDFPGVVKTFEHLKLHGAFLTNNAFFPQQLSPEISGRVAWGHINFHPYSSKTMVKILRQRVELGLVEGAIADGHLQHLVAKTLHDNGDIRTAIRALYHATKNAELENKKIVTKKHITQGWQHIFNEQTVDALKTLANDSVIILMALGSKVMQSRELYRNYQDVCNEHGFYDSSYPTFWRRIEELENIYHFIKTTDATGKRGGKTRRIQSNLSESIWKLHKDEILQNLNPTVTPNT
jgi:cell division control protein 6